MHEIVVNTHIHSYLSDGHGTYHDIANAAAQCSLDAVIITDHNVHIKRREGYYSIGEKSILLLSGQEIHDQNRNPQKNHLLIFNPAQDYSPYANDPSHLIQKAQSTGALSFIAHPVDPELPCIGEPDISWEDWSARDFTGLELWNGFSEIKYRSHNMFQVLFYAFYPKDLAHKPLPETLKLWDHILQQGVACVAIGGSDAHALQKKAGFLRKTVFPYTYHFSAINNHLLLDKPLSSDAQTASSQIYSAFKNGNLFIGYDLPSSTHGFRFIAQVGNKTIQMGSKTTIKNGITIQINTPRKAKCVLFRDGIVEKSWHETAQCTYITNKPGIYRVEVYLDYFGKERGWIYSNPIYVD